MGFNVIVFLGIVHQIPQGTQRSPPILNGVGRNGRALELQAQVEGGSILLADRVQFFAGQQAGIDPEATVLPGAVMLGGHAMERSRQRRRHGNRLSDRRPRDPESTANRPIVQKYGGGIVFGAKFSYSCPFH